MVKSLYIRLAVTFVGIVALSFLIAFSVTSYFYKNRFEEVMKNEISDVKQSIEAQLQYANINEIKENIQLIYHYQVDFIPYGKSSDDIPKDELEEIYSGKEIYNPIPGSNMYIGLPITIEGEKVALILKKSDIGMSMLFKSLFDITWIAILIGTIFILIVTRSIVFPVTKLTEATKQLAQGNFDATYQTKRKDEIGQLSESFNEMAKELSLLVKMREDFVSNVSHEFQTPITSILGFTKALQHKQLTEEQRKRYLSIIRSESERLSYLSKDILRLSHLQHGQYQLVLSTFSLDEQIRNVLITQEPQWSAKNLKISLDLERSLIKADESLLQQVWVNLISNAIKFSPENGEIYVCGKQLDMDKIEISIKDLGPGIPESEQKLVFTPFYKVDQGSDVAVKGNGLGLTIVQQIVALHRGTIQIVSGDGIGTTLIVTLPNKLLI
ncbi:sensor histidine kinase [Peribacillus asahii]|uniref:Heme sensor protein HssS n=1 Tax=Peribacillus asahii TaxID=228899 RepID=A0A398AX85_9BACI|nr:HAMP domain-containing sensor histidine kinase [Peribacillus asahii]RID82205.1 sensor histidine kinase [Peribacillus asahii]